MRYRVESLLSAAQLSEDDAELAEQAKRKISMDENGLAKRIRLSN